MPLDPSIVCPCGHRDFVVYDEHGWLLIFCRLCGGRPLAIVDRDLHPDLPITKELP